ncbi:MAG: bifunctional phosphopantothenoylcysteine decarboxylase/phosphopantothenate--cysteine ligase CoaBC [Lactobacillus sp.]|nr:bifunctional phosphopantothenoylcysteine decarboxylase/phosphopantothenate--cysteine ligase CoaBC [Lactobacillus sp.]
MKNKHIALYISGGIAVYKAAMLARLFIKKGAKVRVAMTKAAQEFVTPLTFKGLTHHEVYTDLFSKHGSPVPHIELADWSDLAVVVPATADILAKMAQGIADDFVPTALLATEVPKYVVPAMNNKMWANPATRRNVAQLKTDGVNVLEPATGFLAEGYDGKGRMPEPEEILTWIEGTQASNFAKDLAGKKILLSAGGTIEPIDPVRYLANRSSGKMGYSLAEVAQSRGAKVTLVSGPTALKAPKGVEVINVKTAREMEAEMLAHYATADFVIMAAAVADYRLAQVYEQKVKKVGETWQLNLVRNPDILKHLGELKQQQLLVGFAAETTELVKHATEKLRQKNVDLLVANDVSRKDIGFGTNDNAALLLTRDKAPQETGKMTKQQLADLIYDRLLELAKERE